MTSFKILALALCLATSSVLVPQKSHAFLLSAGAAGFTPEDGPWGSRYRDSTTVLQTFSLVTLCIVTLPFCLLDQESDAKASASTEELAANGYSAEEIALIQKDQKTLSQKLIQQKVKLVVRNSDTKQVIEREIKSIYPEVSDLYLDFTFAATGL